MQSRRMGFRWFLATAGAFAALLIAVVVPTPTHGQGPSPLVGNWMGTVPGGFGSTLRIYLTFRPDGTYESTTLVENVAAYLKTDNKWYGKYEAQQDAPNHFVVHIHVDDFNPKQYCNSAKECWSASGPPEEQNPRLTVSGSTMTSGDGTRFTRVQTLPPLAARVFAPTTYVPNPPGSNRPAPVPVAHGGGGNTGGGGAIRGGSSTPPNSCRNAVEQQICISHSNSNSYMYTDSRGCRVCKYVP